MGSLFDSPEVKCATAVLGGGPLDSSKAGDCKKTIEGVVDWVKEKTTSAYQNVRERFSFCQKTEGLQSQWFSPVPLLNPLLAQTRDMTSLFLQGGSLLGLPFTFGTFALPLCPPASEENPSQKLGDVVSNVVSEIATGALLVGVTAHAVREFKPTPQERRDDSWLTFLGGPAVWLAKGLFQ